MKSEDLSENVNLNYNESEDEVDSNLNVHPHFKGGSQGKQYRLKMYVKSEKETPQINSPEQSVGLVALNFRTNQAPKIRERADEKQTQLLEDIFSKNQKMTKKAALALKDQIGLSEKFISVWFQNRRVKERNKTKFLQPNAQNKAKRNLQATDFTPPEATKDTEEVGSSGNSFVVESGAISGLPPKPHSKGDFYKFIRADSKPRSFNFNRKFPTSAKLLKSFNHPKVFTYTNPHFKPCPLTDSTPTYPDKLQSDLYLSANPSETSSNYHPNNTSLNETSKLQQSDSAILVQPSAVEMSESCERSMSNFKLENNEYLNQLNFHFADPLKFIGESNLRKEKVKPIVYNFKFKFDYNRC